MPRTDRHLLNVEQIITFANEVKISDVKETIERQIEYNMAIAQEGLRGNWGAKSGRFFYSLMEIATEPGKSHGSIRFGCQDEWL